MAFAYKKLTSIITLSGTSQSIYSHNSGTYTVASYIRSILVHNIDTNPRTVTLYYLLSGQSVASVNPSYELFKFTIPAGGTWMIEFPIPGLMFDTNGDALYAAIDANSKGTIMVMGAGE